VDQRLGNLRRPHSQIACPQDSSKACPVHPRGNGYQALFGTEVSEGGKGEEWHIISVATLPAQIRSLTAAWP